MVCPINCLHRYQALLATARQQKRAKRLEDMEAGRHKPLLEDPSQVWKKCGKSV